MAPGRLGYQINVENHRIALIEILFVNIDGVSPGRKIENAVIYIIETKAVTALVYQNFPFRYIKRIARKIDRNIYFLDTAVEKGVEAAHL